MMMAKGQPERPANQPKYKVEFRPSAKKALDKLDVAVRAPLLERIATLRDNPRPRGVEKMKEEENLYRVRLGLFRIVYSIRDKELLVLVVKVGPRKDVYKKR
jgi:mRNA interferase RelE/StbE